MIKIMIIERNFLRSIYWYQFYGKIRQKFLLSLQGSLLKYENTEPTVVVIGVADPGPVLLDKFEF